MAKKRGRAETQVYPRPCRSYNYISFFKHNDFASVKPQRSYSMALAHSRQPQEHPRDGCLLEILQYPGVDYPQ